MKNRILVIGTQCVKKQSSDFAYHSEGHCQPELSLQKSRNMVKVLSSSFEKSCGPFTVLLVEGCSGTGLFRHLSQQHISESVSLKIHCVWWISFFKKCWKRNLNLENSKKTSQILFRLWDNCIWKCCCKLSLIRREYLLSALNGLTNSPEIFHITQGDFFNNNCLYKCE